MSNKKTDFHEFALQSSLFKGRVDWYFCFLKSERIAHVLSVIANEASERHHDDVYVLRDKAIALISAVADMAAGRLLGKEVLAEMLSLMANLRLLSTVGALSKDTARILVEEYEALAQKIDVGEQTASFFTADDLAVPLSLEQPQRSFSAALPNTLLSDTMHVKDIYKGHSLSLGPNHKRSEEILSIIGVKKQVAIKDIAAVVRGCSEKTIQRELTELVRQGLVRKVGERRWSQYVLA